MADFPPEYIFPCMGNRLKAGNQTDCPPNARAITKEKHMAKKFLLVSVLAAFVAGGAFAQLPLSVGGGFLAQGGKVGGFKGKKLYDDLTGFSTTLPGSSLDHFGFGGFIFADAKFVELAIGLAGGESSWNVAGLSQDGSISSLDFSLLGKLPIGGKVFSIFPLLGIGYNVVLSSKVDVLGKTVDFPGKDKASDLSVFRITAGVGSDIGIVQNLFIRTEVLGYLGLLQAKYIRDMYPAYGEAGSGIRPFGITAKLAVGYRF